MSAPAATASCFISSTCPLPILIPAAESRALHLSTATTLTRYFWQAPGIPRYRNHTRSPTIKPELHQQRALRRNRTTKTAVKHQKCRPLVTLPAPSTTWHLQPQQPGAAALVDCPCHQLPGTSSRHTPQVSLHQVSTNSGERPRYHHASISYLQNLPRCHAAAPLPVSTAL